MNTRLIIGALVVLIGISILLDLNLFRFLLPIIIIWIGVQIITGKDGETNSYNKIDVEEDTVKRVLVFSGVNQVILSEDFQGGEIISIFGKATIDLSKVKVQGKKVQIHLVAVVGGVEIITPKNWAVTSEGIGVLGTFNNKANGSLSSKRIVEVRAKGVSVLGRVEVVS